MFFKSGSVSWIVVGLGNPGSQYDKTRHNVGFRVIDKLAENLGVKVNRSKFKALTATVTIGGEKVLLLKPQTYMNASGLSVEPAASFYKVPRERILVVFDDVSLPVGKIRCRADGSAGGHNGIKSLISSLGGQDFPRIKVGVGEKPHADYDLADWVLSKFTAKEEKDLAPAISNAAEAVEYFLKQGAEKTAARFNGL